MRWGTLAALLGVFFSAARADAARYTLEQLLAKVQAEYPGVIAARAGVDSADAQLSQATRLWWPTGDFYLAITGSPEARCQTWDAAAAPGGTFFGGGPAADQGSRFSKCDRTTDGDPSNPASHVVRPTDVVLPTHGVLLNLGFTLLQPLYTSGKIEAARGAAIAGRDAAKGNVEAARADVTLNAVRAYWGVKLARAVIDTLQDGRDKLKTWIDKVDKDIDSDKPTFTFSDRARLKLALDNAELVIIDAQRNLRIALSGLRTLVSEDDADVDEEEIDLTEIKEQPLSYYEDEARLHRPEARLLDAGAAAAKSWRRLKLAEMLPDFGLRFSFGYGYAQSIDTPFNGFLASPNYTSVGLFLVMRQPLDIAMRLARFDQARADERAFEARRKQALGGIAWEIESAYANLEEARRRFTLTGHAEKVARGWYTTMDSQIDSSNAATTINLSDSARQYFEMRIRHLQAIMDVNVALGVLRRATGVK